MDWLLQNWEPLLAALWPLLAFLATITPTEFDNSVLAALRKILDALAFNWGNAENKKQP